MEKEGIVNNIECSIFPNDDYYSVVNWINIKDNKNNNNNNNENILSIPYIHNVNSSVDTVSSENSIYRNDTLNEKLVDIINEIYVKYPEIIYSQVRSEIPTLYPETTTKSTTKIEIDTKNSSISQDYDHSIRWLNIIDNKTKEIVLRVPYILEFKSYNIQSFIDAVYKSPLLMDGTLDCTVNNFIDLIYNKYPEIIYPQINKNKSTEIEIDIKDSYTYPQLYFLTKLKQIATITSIDRHRIKIQITTANIKTEKGRDDIDIHQPSRSINKIKRTEKKNTI